MIRQMIKREQKALKRDYSIWNVYYIYIEQNIILASRFAYGFLVWFILIELIKLSENQLYYEFIFKFNFLNV